VNHHHHNRAVVAVVVATVVVVVVVVVVVGVLSLQLAAIAGQNNRQTERFQFNNLQVKVCA